jgi:hypothetical protein
LAATSSIHTIVDELMSLVVIAWFWIAEVSVVSARSDGGYSIAATVDALVIAVPSITLYSVKSNGSIFIVALAAIDVTVSYLTSAFNRNNLWQASVLTWGDEIWWHAKSVIADAVFALTSLIVFVVVSSEGVVLWAWSLVSWALDLWWAATVWAFPTVTASIVSEVFRVVGLSFTDTSWLSFTAASSAYTSNFVSAVTSTGFTHVDHPSITDTVVLSVLFTRALGAWDSKGGKTVLPTVVSGTSSPVIASFSRWEDFAVWLSTWAVVSWDASLEVGEDLSFWADNHLFIVAKVNACAEVVSALREFHGKAVAELVTSESAYSSRLAWGSTGHYWSGWSWCISSSDLLKTNALDFVVHAVARLNSGRKMWDLFSFGELEAFNFHTEALFEVDASHTIFRKDGVVGTFATFNTYINAFSINSLPFTEVGTSLWTRADTWAIVSVSIALHWAHTLVSPFGVDTLSVTSLSIGSNGGTEAFAFSTGVASAGVKLTVVKVVLWVDMAVTFSKWTGLVLDERTSFGGPGLSEWVKSADVKDSLWLGASRD